MRSSRGFTIVELLIVIVVIAVLAAITVMAYNGIQNRANDSTIQQDLALYAKKAELFKIDNTSGMYPGSTADLASLQVRATQSVYDTSYYNLYYCTPSARTSFTFVSRSKSGAVYYASSQGRGTLGNAALSTSGACSTIGIDTAVDPYFNSRGKTNDGSGNWQAWTQ